MMSTKNKFTESNLKTKADLTALFEFCELVGKFVQIGGRLPPPPPARPIAAYIPISQVICERENNIGSI